MSSRAVAGGDTRKSAQRYIMLSLLSCVLIGTLLLAGWLDFFELKAYDLFCRLFAPAVRSDRIVIVTIDQRSIDALAAESVTWPWPRQIYVPVIRHLAGAEAVFMDLTFTEDSSYGVQDDMLLAEAIRQTGNVYLPLFLSDTAPKNDAASVLQKSSVDSAAPTYRAYPSLIPPIAPLADAAAGAGNVMVKPDDDGVYRAVPLLFSAGGRVIPFSLLGRLFSTGALTVTDGTLRSDGRTVPLDHARLLLRYSGAREPFATLSVIDLIRDGAAEAVLKGKYVFIGTTAAGLLDLKPTPVSAVSTGVSIHATVLQNLIDGSAMRPVGTAWTILFMAAVGMLIGMLMPRATSLPLMIVLLLAAVASSVALPAVLFALGFWMKIVAPFLSAVIAYAVTASFSYATEGKERRFMKQTLLHYMDRNIVEHILRNPQLIRPGGEQRRVTVFFADIAGFSTLAEKLPVQETASILHDIFNSFTEIIIANHGVFDKYIGDCVMAFWGAPAASPRDEADACRAALACMHALEEINRTFQERGLADVSVRIGIHSGEAIVGNLGSDRLFNYTVMGDTVNLASRLESANKFFRTRIIISDETHDKTDNRFLVRDLGKITVKGKEKPVGIYELLAERTEIGENEDDLLKRYAEGLALFRERQWGKARDTFSAILRDYPADGPSSFYRGRCEELLLPGEIPADWEIIRMKEK